MVGVKKVKFQIPIIRVQGNAKIVIVTARPVQALKGLLFGVWWVF